MSKMALPQSRRVLCVVLPGFSALALASATEPFAACHRISDANSYRVVMISTGEHLEVLSDAGLRVHCDLLLSQCKVESGDALLLCGGAPMAFEESPRVCEWVRQEYRACEWVAGIAMGGHVLAQAGLLAGKKASLHGQSLHELRARFPDILLSTDVFSIDGHMATCRSATAAMDLIFVLIGHQLGKDMLDALSQYFVRERVGIAGTATGRVQPGDALMREQPKLGEAIALMESNIEEPLSTDDIAGHVGLSRRHLERLFKKHLHAVPSRYYLLLRLEQARNLLQAGGVSITEVAAACGFASTAHFSTVYRNLSGLTPSEERQMALLAGNSAKP